MRSGSAGPLSPASSSVSLLMIVSGSRNSRRNAGVTMAEERENSRRSFPDKMKTKLVARRDGRVAEGARLESVYTLTGIGGSNPSLSARTLVIWNLQAGDTYTPQSGPPSDFYYWPYFDSLVIASAALPATTQLADPATTASSSNHRNPKSSMHSGKSGLIMMYPGITAPGM